MNRRILTLAAVALLVAAGVAQAQVNSGALCTIDDVPAATLLLPYFEVDLDDPAGVTTLFSVNNASATAVLAHVVVWSDLSVPVLDFNIYLTGYDVQSINMRDILAGSLPQTASAGQDPGDTISPQGDFSQDINFASCSGQLPPPQLNANFIAHLENSLTGVGSSLFGGLCAGVNHGDNIARGYVTVDTVNNCTLRFPGDAGYFTGDITFQNVLWGDYFYVNSAENFAQGETLVHVQADPTAFMAGDYTFYGRYNAWTALDGREPLATTFATRYLDGGAFDGGTTLLVWRDSKTDVDPFTCGTLPSPFPLSQNQIVIFDEEENPDVPTTTPVSPQPPGESLIPFPWETQRTKVNGPDFPVPFEFGWLYLNLNTSTGAAVDPYSQNWVTTEMDASGRFSVGFDAIQLDSVCTSIDALIGFN